MSKLVTICIPTYNSEETIEDTINSILNQTYKNIQIKVFDNCSLDNTVQIITKLKQTNSNIELNINNTNIGGEANFTKCLEVSEGDYTGIFHADDIYFPTIIEKQVNILNKNIDVVAVTTNALEINSDNKVIGKRFWPYEFRKNKYSFLNFNKLLSLTLKYSNFITCPSVLARSDIYKNEIKKWNGTDFKTSADLDVWFRLAKFGNIAFITEPLINYRVDTQSFSFNLKQVRTHRHDMFLVLDHYKNKADINQNHYNFLILKDDALRVLNTMRAKNSITKLPKLTPGIISLASVGLHDFKHFKEYFAILLIWFMSRIYSVLRLNT